MTYIIFSAFLGLIALAVAVVPVAVILRQEERSGPAAPALLRPTAAANNHEEWSLTA